jgi:hypothetical protein
MIPLIGRGWKPLGIGARNNVGLLLQSTITVHCASALWLRLVSIHALFGSVAGAASHQHCESQDHKNAHWICSKNIRDAWPRKPALLLAEDSRAGLIRRWMFWGPEDTPDSQNPSFRSLHAPYAVNLHRTGRFQAPQF